MIMNNKQYKKRNWKYYKHYSSGEWLVYVVELNSNNNNWNLES